MNWLAARIKIIMLIAGLLTATMFFAAIAPGAALRSTFGEALDGAVADVVVRNWGALIGMIGLMLIYGAFHPPVRRLVVTVAAASKLVFIGLVLSHGRQFLDHQAGVAVAVDAVMVMVFGLYLLAEVWRRSHGRSADLVHSRGRSGSSKQPRAEVPTHPQPVPRGQHHGEVPMPLRLDLLDPVNVDDG